MAGMLARHVCCLLLLVGCATGPRFESVLTPGSFEGWHTAPGGTWTWRGDVLVGESPRAERRHGILISDARYTDFEARVEFRVLSGDSGFYFRVDEKGGAVAVHGFQSEVDTTLETGGLYFRATAGQLEIDEIAKALGGLDQQEFGDVLRTRYEERYQYPLTFALLALIAETLLGDRRRVAPAKDGR